jgi:hypothetical protein
MTSDASGFNCIPWRPEFLLTSKAGSQPSESCSNKQPGKDWRRLPIRSPVSKFNKFTDFTALYFTILQFYSLQFYNFIVLQFHSFFSFTILQLKSLTV